MDLATILKLHRKGQSDEYNNFISKVSQPDIKANQLVFYLKELQQCVTKLDKHYEILVGWLLKIDWPSRDEKVVHEFQKFLLNLISAHPFYLHSCLMSLVNWLLPASSLESVQQTEVLSFDVQQAHQLQFTNIHLVLKALSTLVPMSSEALMPILLKAFPYFKVDKYALKCYVKNLLHITTYIPTLRCSILQLIVEKMINLDVAAPRQEVKAFDCHGEQEDITNNFLSMDLNGQDASTTSMRHNIADMLDILMDIIFKYIYNTCFQNGELDWEATKILHRELLLVFQKIILPTHRSCHVQFIMFYICSFKQPLADGFLDYLWKKFLLHETEVVYRQSAVAFVGGLLSRASYSCVDTVEACLGLMVKWAHEYLDSASDCIHADVAHHGCFYAVCQTVFYVFVFRSREILEKKKGRSRAESWNFQRIVTSQLNPLRVCSPKVVEMFSSVSRLHQLAYCDTIIQRNRRLQHLLDTANQDGVTNFVLDFSFPFDPYLLKRSSKYITSLYREFQGFEKEEREESEEDDDFLPPHSGADNGSAEGIVASFLVGSPMDAS